MMYLSRKNDVHVSITLENLPFRIKYNQLCLNKLRFKKLKCYSPPCKKNFVSLSKEDEPIILIDQY